MIETALLNFLNNDGGVSDAVDGRIQPYSDADISQLPRLTYWRTNSNYPISNDGPIGQCIATFQIDAWAADIATCWQAMEAVRLAANGFSGVVSGQRIDCIRVSDRFDQINTPALDGRQKSIQRSTMTIVVSYGEATIEDAFSSAFSSAFA